MTKKKNELFRSLANASSRAVWHVEKALKRHGLASVTQFIYLRALTEAPGGYLYVGDLQTMATFGVPDVARVVDRLVRNGLAGRAHDDADRRRVRVWATVEGREVVEAAAGDYQQAIAEALAPFDEDDIRVARSYCEAIAEQVEALNVSSICA